VKNGITFITGNPNKAAYVSEALGVLINHKALDLDEIQSLGLRQVVDHKARQAYDHLQQPVLVEDVSLEFQALGRLPGTFIKWFLQDIGMEKLCLMLNGFDTRVATARICYGLYDGCAIQFFEASMTGRVPESPRGTNGFGWDQIFIKDGMGQTRAELDTPTERATSMRREPLERLARFLHSPHNESS
jgi:non-canonical purine NTP pyrophosphatase (RdgB/HAM1 family)